MFLLRLLIGTALLVGGRRLFWLFLGGVGFVFGFDLAERTIHGHPHHVILIALLAGVIGAALAVLFQRFAVGLGGFFAGGYIFIGLMKELGVATGQYHWVLFLAGGILGAFFMSVVFDWTLIVLSSAIGSVLILHSLHPSHDLARLVFLFLLIAGIAVQAGLVKRSRAH